MAFSSSEGKQLFTDWIEHIAKPLNFKTFLDVGCGAGIYGKLIREKMGDIDLTGFDIFPEYVERHGLSQIYNKMIIGDIQNQELIKTNYDLIIAGDVLEHLPKAEAIKVVDRLKDHCRFLWAALPVKVDCRLWSTGYNQGEDDYKENPYNKHYHDWRYQEILDTFNPLFLVPFIQTGTFLIEGLL